MSIFIVSIVILGLLGLSFAALLGLAANYFKVKEDPLIETLLAILPGANCGACGATGCRDFAEKVIKGQLAVSGCTVGGNAVAQKIATLLGTTSETLIKKIAVIHCGATEKQRSKKADYNGVKNCAAAALVDGAGLACAYGCLGFGDCYDTCPFDAVRMIGGLPVIDREKCTACGKCVTACPRQLISLRPDSFPVAVACASHERGAVVRQICPVGCIACLICQKEVPEVFKVAENLAIIDYTKNGIDCSSAIEKCPTKCIIKY